MVVLRAQLFVRGDVLNGIDKYAPLPLVDSLIVSVVSMLVVFLVLTVIMMLIQLIGAVSKESSSSVASGAPVRTEPTATTASSVPQPVDIQAVPQEHIAAITATLSVMLNTSAANINITKITAK